MQPLDKQVLMGLRVKDLRWYLSKRRISAHFCKEKSELVDLILQANGYRTSLDDYSNSARSRPETRRTSATTTAPRPAEQGSSTDTSSASDGSSWVLVGDEDNDIPSAQGLDVPNSEQSVDPNASPARASSASASEYKPFNIDDVQTEAEVQALSVRQMKLILTRNFVDYKGCCEKDELFVKVLRLWKDRKDIQAQNTEDISDENICKICMETVIDCVLLECGHMVTCTICGKRLNECPICRQYVVRAVRIFKS
jgi:hypothetical protein